MDKKQIERAVAVLLNNATFGCVSKYDDGTSTPNRLMQLECAEYLHSLISEEKFSDTYSFILGQFEAVEESEEKAGWKCVPLEPTQGMLDMAMVAFQETSKTMGRHAADKAAYCALIAAAPEQNRIQELISQRDHAMQDSQHWADKYGYLKSENDRLKDNFTRLKKMVDDESIHKRTYSAGIELEKKNAELQKEVSQLAEFVVAVGGFWGESKSVLTGKDSLAEALQEEHNVLIAKLDELQAQKPIAHEQVEAAWRAGSFKG